MFFLLLLKLCVVSFLHDVQAVTHMVRSLEGLINSTEDQTQTQTQIRSTPDEHILRGAAAETG